MGSNKRVKHRAGVQKLFDPSKNIISGWGISPSNKYIWQGKAAASRITHNVINENGFGDAGLLQSEKDF